MIKKIKIKNFKSLKDVEIELGKFNILIGPNASGKSNILDSLMFLSESARQDLGSAINVRGGFDHIVFGGKGDKFELSIDYLLDSLASSYVLCVDNRRDVERERLVVGRELVIERKLRDGIRVLINDGERISTSIPANETFIHSNRQNDIFPLVQNTYNYLNSWKLYQISTPEVRRVIAAKKCFDLEKNGANMAQVLISLHNERPKLFDRIQDMLRQGIPEIEELLTPLTTDGNTHIAIREKGFEREFDYYQVSDGTIKLLAYITAVTLPESNLICFEEPENFIHPELLRLLVELLKKSDKQILLSTHSPNFVNFVEPEEIRVVEKEGGETKVSKVENPERLKEALKEIGLGELWYSGELGGVP